MVGSSRSTSKPSQPSLTLLRCPITPHAVQPPHRWTAHPRRHVSRGEEGGPHCPTSTGQAPGYISLCRRMAGDPLSRSECPHSGTTLVTIGNSSPAAIPDGDRTGEPDRHERSVATRRRRDRFALHLSTSREGRACLSMRWTRRQRTPPTHLKVQSSPSPGRMGQRTPRPKARQLERKAREH